jgi:hypothetical protein
MAHKASCSCGQLSLTYSVDIKRTSICHCLECQKRTGSVFGVQTRLKRDQTEITGTSTEYERVGDEGTKIKFHFCPNCGCTLYWEYEGNAEDYIAAIGAFSDPTLPSPVFSVYRARKHHWVEIPASVTDDWD